jgi:hypothetical protein
MVVRTGGWGRFRLPARDDVADVAEFQDIDGAYAVVARNVEDFLV